MIFNVRLLFCHGLSHQYTSKVSFSPIRNSLLTQCINQQSLSLCQLCSQGPKHSKSAIIFLRGRKHFAFGGHSLWPVIRGFRVSATQAGNLAKSGTAKRGVFGREMKRLLSLAKTEKWNLTGAIFLLLISSTITMAVPFALGKVIDLIYTSDAVKMKENLNKLCLALFFVFLLGGACNFGRVYLMNMSGQRITRLLRERVFNSIMRQDVVFFDKNKTGELINRLSADTSLVSQCVTMNISDGLRSIIMVVAGVSMMFYMSIELAFVSLLIVPPVAGMAIVYGRFIRKITKNVQDALADATQVAEERISNIRTVKSFGKEEQEIRLYQDRMQTVLDLASKEALARGAFFGMAGLSGNIVVLSVLYYGGVMVSGDGLSVGDLSAFLLYAAYIGVSLSGITSFYSEMNRGLGASARLWDIVDQAPQFPTFIGDGDLGGGKWAPVDGDMKFEEVVFRYPAREGEHDVLRGVTLGVPAGRVTAVVGPSGSGKSTLAALALRLYEPTSGLLLLDGKPLSNYHPRHITRYVATVSQEPVLFSGSIRENVLYGAETDISPERLNEVLTQANVYDFANALPDKLDTLVGERGVMLSGGQKQRVAIARALIKDPRILLLDEATSALDSESEFLVQEALERIMKGRTVLTIAHRLSTIKNADQIAVLDGGRIVEVGNYEELMQIENGAFKKLVKHQTFDPS